MPATVHGPIPLRELLHRVDALTLAYKGTLRLEVARKLDEAAGWAAMSGTPVAVSLGEGMALVMGPRSRRGWYHLSTDEVAVVVDEAAAHGWLVEVRPRAVLLARVGHDAAQAVAEALAVALLNETAGKRDRRVDLAVDFDGFDLGSIEPGAWVGPRRAKVRDLCKVSRPVEDEKGCVSTYYQQGKRTGFVVGSSDVVCRVYDKTEELGLPQNAGPKRDEEHARMKAAGWDGEARVVRVEFQIRGGALDQLDVRDPEKLLASLDALWAYCTRKWLRLVVQDSAPRRDRCDVDPRWLAVQGVVWTAAEAPRERFRKPPVADGARLASLALNAYTPAEVEQVLEHLHLQGDGAALRVMRWNDHAAARVLRFLLCNSQLVEHYVAACEAWAASLEKSRGARRALVYVLQRMKASAARRTEIDVGLYVERASLAGFGPVKASDRGEASLRALGKAYGSRSIVREVASLGLFGQEQEGKVA